MSNEKLTMFNIYQRLEKIGFSKEFIKSIGLPSWWVDELDQSTNINTVYEGAGHIAQRLFLDLKSLLNPNQEVKFKYNMSYMRVMKSLRERQKCLKELQLLGVDILSSDLTDYLEQLLLLDF